MSSEEKSGPPKRAAFPAHGLLGEEHADLAPGMDIAGNGSLAGYTRGFLGRNRDATLAEHDDGLLHVALGFGQGLLAIHHGRTGFFPELFYLIRRDIHSRCTHKVCRWLLVVGRLGLAETEPPATHDCYYKI